MRSRAGGAQGREETLAERSDRNWNDLLQEFRVLQTGVQILGGFLLTLPFASAFDDLDDVQRGIYLALVLLATSTIAVLLTPIATHRRVFGWQVKHRLVRAGHVLARVVLVMIGVLVAGIAVFVFDVVVGRGAALAVGAGMGVLVGVTLVGLPILLGGRPPDSDPDRDPEADG